MNDYNVGERKDIRRAEKDAKLAETARHDVVRGLMSVPAGRSFVLSKLTQAHVFHTSFSSDPLQMAFAEGERNQGLQLLNDIMLVCPDMYVQMMKEKNVRELTASARRSSRTDRGDSGSESEEADRAWDNPDEDGDSRDPNQGDSEPGEVR